ncbi:sensor histidine kinase [Streptomyces aidingensis]|uniref:Signal transduction histidine kinase n=1 Tax=Streptomyces aidingensis TaxID=910347 RepID=A0A1I1QY14_9ACTN|nr:histidine kinase [Streptomyces aidingensis]SFD27011.1 Signal transduction histidine kinase [Streptomyces aidingensis]
MAGAQARRLAHPAALAVFSAYYVVSLLNVGSLKPGPTSLLAFAGCAAAAFAIHLVHLAAARRWPARLRMLTLLLQAAISFLPLLWLGQPWGSMTAFLVGSLLLLLPGWTRWVCFGATVAAVLALSTAAGGDTLWRVYLALAAVNSGLAVYGLSRLSASVLEVRRTRGELARLAVMRERLRVARDLHDLLGYSLSAITLKSELAHRLLPQAPERAREQVGEALAVSRQALADVRSVASGYREMSLEAEADSARSVLAAADIEVELTVAVHCLPAEVDTLLATVLREAVTNVLRHSRARRVEIRLTETGGTIGLTVVNDGPKAPPRTTAGPDAGPGGSGLRNLTERVEQAGGALSAGPDAEGRFRVAATVPRGEAAPAPAGGVTAASAAAPPPAAAVTEPAVTRPAVPDTGPDDPAGGAAGTELTDLTAPRLALVVALVVFSGYVVLAVLNVLQLWPGADPLALAFWIAVILACQLAHSLTAPAERLSRLRPATLAVQAVATYLPLAWFGWPWAAISGFLAGSVLLVVSRGRFRWPLFGLVVCSMLVIARDAGMNWVDASYVALNAVISGLTVYGLSRLSGTVVEVRRSRGELARLAVTRERLRVARELHDLLGYSLSEITVKSELVHRLLPAEPDRAREQVGQALVVSRQALADVRSVARGYREMSLEAEADSARSVLVAADVEVDVAVSVGILPAETGGVLAAVLREAVTNILRHSRARRVEIVVVQTDGLVRLSVVNDGALPAEAEAVREDDGGLADLAVRVVQAGGTLHAGLEAPGRFRLTAEAPLTAPHGDGTPHPAPTSEWITLPSH